MPHVKKQAYDEVMTKLEREAEIIRNEIFWGKREVNKLVDTQKIRKKKLVVIRDLIRSIQGKATVK